MRDPDKPQQIIEAAVRVFARQGYFNSRVSDVAREAGIAAGTIYLYFKTKEDILITLFREKMATFVASLRRAISDEPDAVLAERLTREIGVASIPVSAFYATPPADRLLRFCFAKNDDTLASACDRLARA